MILKQVNYHSLDNIRTDWEMDIQTMTYFANGLDYVSL